MGMVITQSASFLDRDGGIDSGLTHHVSHAEGNESGDQACEQTSDQEAACGSSRRLSGRGSRAGAARRGPTHGLRCPTRGAGTLLRGDEVHGDEQHHRREDQPGQHLGPNENGGAATATGLVWVTSDISSSSGFLRPALPELVGGRV